MRTIGVVRSIMQQTHSTSTSTTETRTTTIRQILIAFVPLGILQQINNARGVKTSGILLKFKTQKYAVEFI
jgi:hypothetical protein